jgi:hypothetical protein
MTLLTPPVIAAVAERVSDDITVVVALTRRKIPMEAAKNIRKTIKPSRPDA